MKYTVLQYLYAVDSCRVSKALEKEKRELKKATEILSLASAFFAKAEPNRLKDGCLHRSTSRHSGSRANLYDLAICSFGLL